MRILSEKENKMIEVYKKTNQEDIALYFFNEFKDDLVNITFSKINKKFTSIPYEKDDLIHLVWRSIKNCLVSCKTPDDFLNILVRNCYFSTIREIQKFLNNKQMVMNVSYSLDTLYEQYLFSKSVLIQQPKNEIIKDLANSVCELNKKYSQEVVKKTLYLKSIGYSINEIANILKISRYHVCNLLSYVEIVAKKYY